MRWRTPVVAATHRLKPVTEDAPAPSVAAAVLPCNELAPAALHNASDAPGTDAELGSTPAEGGVEVAALRLAALGQELAAAQLVRSNLSVCLNKAAGQCLPGLHSQHLATNPGGAEPGADSRAGGFIQARYAVASALEMLFADLYVSELYSMCLVDCGSAQ